MTNFTNDFNKLDELLHLARTSSFYTECKDIFELFEIKNKNASFQDIKSQIDEFIERASNSGGPKFESFATKIGRYGQIFKKVLENHRKEYDKYLQENDPVINGLKIHFEVYTKYDRELNSKEKDQLLKEAEDIGLTETKALELINQWLAEERVKEVEFYPSASTSSSIPYDVHLNKTYYEILGVSEDATDEQIKNAYNTKYQEVKIKCKDKKKSDALWPPIYTAYECLKDPSKRRKYDEEQRRKRDEGLTAEGDPKLELEDESGKEIRSYEFKDMRLGTTQSVTVIAKNGGGGTLDAKIEIEKTHPWLIVDTDKIHQGKLPQRVEITVDPTKKDLPKNTFGSKGTGEIKINYKKGGDPYVDVINIAYNIEEDEEDLKLFRRALTICGLALGFILGSLIYNYFIEGNPYNTKSEYDFLVALILIVIVSCRWGYKDAGWSGFFGWGFKTFVCGLIILLILQSWFPHTFSTVLWSLIYGSIANISSDFMRPAIRQRNYRVPIGVGIGVLILTVMIITAGTEGARKKRNAESARLKSIQNVFQTISKKITGEWEGNVGNKRAKLTIHSNGNGCIAYDNIKESLSLNIYDSKYDLAYEEFILKGTSYESLYNSRKVNFSLDTFYGRLSEDGRSISGNFVDTAGRKGNWSVTKHVYTYKTPKKSIEVLDKKGIKDEPGISDIKPEFEKGQDTLSYETESDDEKEEFVDANQIKSKIKKIQRKLDDLRERYENTGEKLSNLNMKTDSSEMADLEVERKKMAQEINEYNIQKGQLLNELNARGRLEWR